MGSLNTLLQADNKTRVAKAEYRAAKQQTQDHNRRQSAESNLSNFMRAYANRAKATASGKEFNHQLDILSEELRNMDGGTLNAQMQLSSAVGALAAQSGYAGVGGSSVDLLDSMVGLQHEMDVEAQRNARDLVASRAGAQTAQIMANAYGSMDLSMTFGNYDFQQHIEPKEMKNRWLKIAGVAVATYFGGPMAGEAAASAAVGEWQAANGDFDGAGRSYGNAMRGALGAYRDWGQRGGESWYSSLMQGRNGSGNIANINWNDGATAIGTSNYGTDSGGIGWGW